MKKNWAALLALVLLGLAAVAAGLSLYALYFRGDRAAYVALRQGDFHPSFFRDYELARREQAGWLKSPQAVAMRYAGATDLCPISTVRPLPAESGRASFTLVNECWVGLYAAKKWRVDLVRVGEIWQIEWSGVTFKCSRNLYNPGTFLVTHNPLRRSRAAWALRFNAAVEAVGLRLNPWQTRCPP